MNQKFALFAGSGILPLKLIEHFQANGISFLVVGFYGQTPEETLKNHNHAWVHLGEVGKTLKMLKSHNVTHVVMAGGIKRPSWSDLKLDWQGTRWIAKCGKAVLGDDGLLKAVIALFETEGFGVLTSQDFFGNTFLTPKGILTKISPKPYHELDIERGIKVLKALSPQDVGQAVVIQQGNVLGIEACEGTSALIERCKSYKVQSADGASNGVLIKMAKEQQTLKADVPTVGLETIEQLNNAGFDGIALQAGATQILDREQFINRANELGLFVVGIENDK